MALELWLGPKSPRELKILSNNGKALRSEVGWKDRGFRWKVQVLFKSQGSSQSCWEASGLQPQSTHLKHPRAKIRRGEGGSMVEKESHDARSSCHGFCRAYSFWDNKNHIDQSQGEWWHWIQSRQPQFPVKTVPNSCQALLSVVSSGQSGLQVMGWLYRGSLRECTQASSEPTPHPAGM